MPHDGVYQHAYLPDNTEGNKVLELLKKAWVMKLTFTIGTSLRTGTENVIISTFLTNCQSQKELMATH